MEIKIPKDDDALVHVISLAFPDQAVDLMQLFQSAKNGITIEILPTKKEQTDSQRNYYWKWVREFAKFTGNTPDEMHDHILGECYGTEFVDTFLGFKKRPQKRSSDADRDEYSELIETLIRVAAFFEFVVPPPKKRSDPNKWEHLIK